MADSNQRDIYHKEDRKPMPPEDRERLRSDPLEVINTAIREDRLALLRFWLVALAFAALIGLVFWQSWQLRHQAQVDPDYAKKTEAPPDQGPLDVVPTLVDEMPVFPRIDALFTLSSPPIESAGNVIDSARLKTAAKALAQAEADFQAKKYRKATAGYREAMDAIPGLRGLNEYLAVCHLQNQEHRLAIEQFALALEYTPDAPSLLNNLGTAHLSLREFEKAAPPLERCVQIRPRYALAHYNLGWLHTQQERYGDATRHLETLLELRPDHFKGVQLYANALLQEKRWGEAVAALRRIVAEVPDAAGPYFKLAQALAEEGQSEEALAHLKTGISRLDHPTARRRLASPEFDKLREVPAFGELLVSVSPDEIPPPARP